MAQHEHDGSGAESETPDRTDSVRSSPDVPDDLGEETGEAAPGAPAPTPREQWFGGFEGTAPPPPPYARPPEETPPPLPGTAFDAPAPQRAEDEETPFDGLGEAGGGTIRLMPGGARKERPAGPWREDPPKLPVRPTRPGAAPRDPLGPRRTRADSDVPEPEQLPPLEAERAEPPSGPWGPESGASASVAHEPHPAPSDRVEPEPFRPPAWPEPTGPRSQGTAPVRRDPPAPPPYPGPDPEAGVTSDALDAATLVRNRRQGPSGGWRKAVHTASLGLINPGESPKVLRERELVARACTPVASGHHRVAVLSLKGGVGKTTTTVALGATLASLRGDRVLAVDANPDRGTLSDKVRLETAATIRDLLNERHLVARYADIRGFTSQSPSRLEILASDRDPAVSEAFSDQDYREVARLVEHFYSICLTDCGTGLLHSAMRGVLGLADQVVLVSSASVDGARSASATLDWLEAHGHGALVASAVVVLSMVRTDNKSSVDLDRLQDHFAGRCRAVVRVPWDGHLEEGAEVDLERLAPATRDAYLQLAANVGEAFAHRG
ncbi:AAA family ATPase [Nocardiopsis alba]|uniref:AAA family ATPase n=1 Tax=Nocardiopsis alba TaxID=53437 RepID=A0ABV5E210_9ACTN